MVTVEGVHYRSENGVFWGAPMIVGITGRAGVGKDTVADWLVDEHGFVKRGLADPIKALLNKRFGWRVEDWQNREWKESPAVSGVFSDAEFGIIGAQDPLLSPRELAQWLGTEVGRHLAGQDVWVNELFKHWKEERNKLLVPRLVIPDVRFNNEATRIKKEGGVVIRIAREVPGVATHISEHGIDRNLVSKSFYNGGTVQELLADVGKWLGLPGPWVTSHGS